MERTIIINDSPKNTGQATAKVIIFCRDKSMQVVNMYRSALSNDLKSTCIAIVGRENYLSHHVDR